MKGKFYSLFVLLLVLVVSVALIFVMDMNNKIEANDGLVVYYTAKVLGLLLLVGVGALVALRPYKGNMPFMMYGLAVIYQFLPLGIRFLVLHNENITFAWVLTLIVGVIFIALILAFDYVSSKDSKQTE